MAPNLASLLRLMLVTDDSLVAGRDLVSLAQAAERGGITSVELRLKRANGRELVAATQALLGALKVPVLVNDRPDVALAAGAAGVHLGPDDLPVEYVRRLAPAGFIVGASAGNEEEAAAARDADYWGIGPWRTTATKGDAGVAIGVEGFSRLLALGAGKPCVAIGGVRPEDVPVVVAAGGIGVAVGAGILAASDVELAARKYGKGVKSEK